MNRKKEREQAFLMLFEGSYDDDLELGEIVERSKLAGKEEYSEFAKNIFVGVKKNKKIITDIIDENLEFWNRERITDVVSALLNFAVYELVFCKELPIKIVINEAIELAKKYGGKDDPAFLNAVLAKVVNNLKNHVND